jgi:hypothetical protein
MTRREKDFAVIGELARRLDNPSEALLLSRSARDLLRLWTSHAALAKELARLRPLLARLEDGRDAIEAALDAERRLLMRADEARLEAYARASRAWAATWLEIRSRIENLELPRAHVALLEAAEGVLPFEVDEGPT